MSAIGSSGGRDRLNKAHLDQVQAYSPGKPIEELERELGIARAIKLASNENPLGPSPKAVEAARAALGDAHRYADTRAFALRAKLCELHGVQPGELAFGNGSNELIDLICRVFAGPSDHAVIGTPSFICYRLCLRVADVPVTEVPLDQGLFWNVDRLLEAVRPNTKLLFLDNPNNPTSTHLAEAELSRLLSALPAHVIPVVDEAYVHFADAADYASALSLRALSPNLIVLRTFSKAFGLAALRAGYAVGPEALLDYLPRVGVPFNLSAPAQAAALAALGDHEHVARCIDLNTRERARLTALLTGLGLAVAPSQANFLCVAFSSEARVIDGTAPALRGGASIDGTAPALRGGASIYAALLQRGVIVRPIPDLPQHLRISVGLPEENDRLLTALREVLS